MRRMFVLLLFFSFTSVPVRASDLGSLHGVVHDPQHRPVKGSVVTLAAARSSFTKTAQTNDEGEFTFLALPLGEYTVSITQVGFAPVSQALIVASGTSSILHLQLQLATVHEAVTVAGVPASAQTVTPQTLVSRADIAESPGAGRTNSLAMITDFVPGAYITHDMLHMRGGHQVSWLIDGVEIPNTDIASNLGAQIDPKDIDYVEVQRGGYAADIGDRTYGVFNVVPRSGFERNREAELLLTAGNFNATDDQINLGDHNEKTAVYASLNGNRGDYGLSPPTSEVFHDRANGVGGFGSVLHNAGAHDQLRLVAQARRDFFQIPYDPDPSSIGNSQFDSSGLRDGQHETDALIEGSLVRTLTHTAVLQLSPFYHFNRANYDSLPGDTPVATTVHRSSNYGGAQASFTAELPRNAPQAGVYGFAEEETTLFGASFNDGSGAAPFAKQLSVTGNVAAVFVSDTLHATSWLTVLGGLRFTHFGGSISENQPTPRVGAAVRVPRLNWTFRAFYGRFYQPPPLLTLSGPVLDYAQGNNTDFRPLRGERDEEHQFGVQIPLRGWVLDADTFKSRANNFLDHANIGASNIYFPVSIDGALVRAWELTVRSPAWRLGHAHLAYSNQIAEQRGGITGGLVCAPFGSPQCDADFGYRPVDHDQRNTLSAGGNVVLPFRANASLNYSYGSGFTNGNPDPTTGYPNAYLPSHSSLALSIGKRLTERLSVSASVLNLANQRTLLDNSLTFGGFHFSDPRQVSAGVRYRFRY